MSKNINPSRIALIVCLCLLLTACANTFSGGNEEQELLDEVLNSVTAAMRYYDDITAGYASILDATVAFTSDDETDASALAEDVVNEMEHINSTVIPINTLAGKEDEINALGLDYLEIESIYSFLPSSKNSYLESLDTIKRNLTENTLPDRNEYLRDSTAIKRTILENEEKIMYLSVNYLLAGIDEEVSAKYLGEVLMTLPRYRSGALAWQTNKDVIEQWGEEAVDNIENATAEYAALVGRLQNTLEQEEQLYRIDENEREIEELYGQLEQSNKVLEELKQQGREKFKPEISDDFAVLWYKALRFHTINDPEYVTLCLNLFVEKAQTAGDANITASSARKIADAAEAFWMEAREGKREGGVMIAYIDPTDAHDFLQAGDIILKVNDASCNTVDEYIANNKKDGSNEIVYLRLENGALVERTDITPAGSGVQIAGVDLIE